MNLISDQHFSLLSENAEVFEFTQLHGMDGVAIISNDLSESWLNPRLLSILGFNIQNSESVNLKSLIPSNKRKELKALFNNASVSSTESPGSGEIYISNSHGIQVLFKYKAIGPFEKEDTVHIIICLEQEKKESNNGLAKELIRYKNILKGTNLGVWQWNVQTGETVFSEEWASVLGYDLDELKPLNEDTWSDLAHSADQKECDQLLEEHFEGETEFYLSEARMKHRSGKWVWVKDQGQVVTWTDDGKPEWMVGFHEQVTEYKERLAIKKLFIDEAPSAIAMFDNQLRYIAASNKWLSDYGLEGQDIIGKSHYEVFPNLSDDWNRIHQECLNGKTHKRDEDSFTTDDGSTHWLSWEVKPWYTSEGKIGGILMHTANITPLKLAQKAVFENQQFMETILDSLNVGIVACDQNARIKLFNKATNEWHGIPADKEIPQEELSKYYDLYSVSEDRLLRTEEIPLIKALNGEKVENDEIRINPKQAKNRIVTANGSRLYDESGEIAGAVIAMHDVTARIEAEEKLRISEATFRESFEHAAIGMAVLDPDGKWLQVNKRVCEIVGYTQKELKKLSFQEITHPEDLDTDLELLEELVAGKREFYHMDKRYFHKKGHIVYIHLAVSLVRDKNGEPLHFVSQIEDISPRKIAEDKLKRTLAQMESLLEASTKVSIIAVDTSGLITAFNKGAENLLGYSKKEMIGKETPVILHDENELQEIGNILEEKTGRHPVGMEIFIELAKYNEFDTREWTYIQKNGGRFPVQLTVTAIRSDKEIIGYLGVATDITKIKKAEREIKNILKVTKDQNDRLKNFAHIVSHNLRSHSGNFGMLLDLYVQDHPEQKDNQIIQMLQQASGNLKETIDHLNEVTIINTAIQEKFNAIQLRKAINTAVNSVSALIQENKVEIINEVPQGLEVPGIPAYIESILLNFTTNAIKYRDPEKDSYIKYSIEELEDYIKLSIEDNGLGIDLKKNRQKLFGMYKTFHRHPDSRGIGLFITKNQIEALGGKIDVKSTVNEGTTFEILLKRNEEN